MSGSEAVEQVLGGLSIDAVALEGDAALALALMRGASVADAARLAQVSTATVYRRLADERFQQLLDQGRRELVGLVAARLAAAAEVGVGVLLEVACDHDASSASRVKAATALVGFAGGFHERAELASGLCERLAELEARERAANFRPAGEFVRR